MCLLEHIPIIFSKCIGLNLKNFTQGLNKEMRAVGIMVHGGPEALEMLNVPEVHAGPGQIRIRNRTSAVNPTDVIDRNGMRAGLQKK